MIQIRRLVKFPSFSLSVIYLSLAKSTRPAAVFVVHTLFTRSFFLERVYRLSSANSSVSFRSSSRSHLWFLGPALILPRDENPRCPPTDTNGYLCQRRNLLLYIPLYKQRVNRARALAPRRSAPRRVRAGCSPHREPRLTGYAPWKPIYRSFRVHFFFFFLLLLRPLPLLPLLLLRLSRLGTHIAVNWNTHTGPAPLRPNIFTVRTTISTVLAFLSSSFLFLGNSKSGTNSATMTTTDAKNAEFSRIRLVPKITEHRGKN